MRTKIFALLLSVLPAFSYASEIFVAMFRDDQFESLSCTEALSPVVNIRVNLGYEIESIIYPDLYGGCAQNLRTPWGSLIAVRASRIQRADCPAGQEFVPSGNLLVCGTATPVPVDGTPCDVEDSIPSVISGGVCKPVMDPDVTPGAFCGFMAAYSKPKKFTFVRNPGVADPGPAPDDFGCAYAPTPGDSVVCVDRPSECLVVDGEAICSQPFANCTVTVQLTGEHVGTESPAEKSCGTLPGQQPCPDAKPATSKDETPCVYTTQPDGTQVCTSTTSSATSSVSECTYGPNGYICNGERPSSATTVIDSAVVTTTAPDGSSTTVKTDTATKVTCSGSLPSDCTSTQATTTTTTRKNPSGAVTNTTVGCVGSACPGSGNPDSDGDGLGDCIGGVCGGANFGAAQFSEFPEVQDYSESTTGFINTINQSAFIQAVKNIQVPSGGACSLPSAQTFFGTISFDSFCDIADDIIDWVSGLILAIYGFAAIRIILSA